MYTKADLLLQSKNWLNCAQLKEKHFSHYFELIIFIVKEKETKNIVQQFVYPTINNYGINRITPYSIQIFNILLELPQFLKLGDINFV